MDTLRPTCLVLNAHYTLIAEPGQFVLRLTRSTTPFASAREVNEACEPVQSALDAAGRSRCSLLIDSRNGPPRNDPEYEANFQPHRQRMVVGLRRVAILMRSAVGKLHAERLLRDSDRVPGRVRIFLDEEEALAFLRGRG